MTEQDYLRLLGKKYYSIDHEGNFIMESYSRTCCQDTLPLAPDNSNNNKGVSLAGYKAINKLYKGMFNTNHNKHKKKAGSL